MYDFGPGPKIVPLNQVVNLQKCGMAFYVTGLMLYFQNFSLAMFNYLLLHGTYGKDKNCTFVALYDFYQENYHSIALNYCLFDVKILL